MHIGKDIEGNPYYKSYDPQSSDVLFYDKNKKYNSEKANEFFEKAFNVFMDKHTT